MFQLTALAILLGLSSFASALEPGDAGNYAVIHRDGRTTDFTFFLSQTDGRWNIEQRQPDGSWINVTCTTNCLLRESAPSDLARFFSENEITETQPACIHNQAFAFCRKNTLLHPDEKEYTLVALMMPRPLQIQLRKLESGWKDPLGRIQPDTESRKAANGFGGWLLVTADSDWETKWNTQAETVPRFSEVRQTERGQPLYALTFFSNPKLTANGDADISCDIDLRKPDGSVSYQQTNATCFKGVLRGRPGYLYLSAPVVRFIGEQDDPHGEWQVRITLKDNVGRIQLPLQTSFILH